MPRILSLVLRERVVAAVDSGMLRRQAAKRFGVSIASAIRWVQLARNTGSAAPILVGSAALG
jgi:transposase